MTSNVYWQGIREDLVCEDREEAMKMLVRNGPVNTACRTLIEESSGCEDEQAAVQGAENRSC